MPITTYISPQGHISERARGSFTWRARLLIFVHSDYHTEVYICSLNVSVQYIQIACKLYRFNVLKLYVHIARGTT
jgi:hypothetical protein